MAVPDYQSVMLPLVRFTAAKGGQASTAEVERHQRSTDA